MLMSRDHMRTCSVRQISELHVGRERSLFHHVRTWYADLIRAGSAYFPVMLDAVVRTPHTCTLPPRLRTRYADLVSSNGVFCFIPIRL
jgi:hypothetical protein